MTSMQKITIRIEQSMKISSLTLDREELLKFCRLLEERSHTARDFEISNYKKGELSDDQYQININTLKEGFLLRITVAGKNGEQLSGTVEEIFSSPNFPDDLSSVFIDNASPLRAQHNYYVRNQFVIFLDFGKPRLLDFNLMPSRETPNESNIKVTGYDATWVNGVFAELKKFIDARSSKLSIVHQHSIYDVLLWVLGLPLGFWACYKISPLITSSFADSSDFLRNALYVYAFVATLIIFRFMFHYLRWVCPLVEYRSPHNKIIAHRILLSIISISVISTFISDVIKFLIW
jgi:hypothetical protein